MFLFYLQIAEPIHNFTHFVIYFVIKIVKISQIIKSESSDNSSVKTSWFSHLASNAFDGILSEGMLAFDMLQ